MDGWSNTESFFGLASRQFMRTRRACPGSGALPLPASAVPPDSRCVACS